MNLDQNSEVKQNGLPGGATDNAVPGYDYHTHDHQIHEEQRSGAGSTVVNGIDFEGFGTEVKNLATAISKRTSIELQNTVNDLKVKIISGVAAAFAVTYAVFWIFAAIVLWLAPAVRPEVTVTVIAVFHLALAGVLYMLAKKSTGLDEAAKETVEKSKQEIKDIFHQLSVKSIEIKKTASESLNPMTKFKRNPEAFLVGSFLLGVALSIFKPSAHGSSQTRNQ